MIVKMKFLSISGPRSDIDRVCEVYLSRHEMQLENAIAELKTTENLLPFVEVNPYREPLNKAEEFMALLPDPAVEPDLTMDQDAMISMIRDLNHQYLELVERKERLKKHVDELTEKLNVLEPFRPYRRLEKYLYEDLNAIFLEGVRNENYVYGCYFVANADAGKTDAIFHSLHFEKISLSREYIGTPAQACESLQQDIDHAADQIRGVEGMIEELLQSRAPQLKGAQRRLEELAGNFDVRKMAARMEDEEDKEDYYIICGWMGEEDVEAFLKETEKDDKVLVVVEEDREKYFGEPPTKLENPRFFKPFEMFVKMYGMPAHNEMDPTVFVAITYTFIFGAMFGDVGQGFCLFAIGGLLYLIKKINLAGIISIAGLFSMLFGFLFGSVFGFEDVIPALWLRPVSAMTSLPFIGQLNTVFVVAYFTDFWS